MSEISLAATAFVQQVATGTSLIQRGTQEYCGQKKDAPAKGRLRYNPPPRERLR